MENHSTTTSNQINHLVELIRDFDAELAALDGSEWFAQEQFEIARDAAVAALRRLTN